MRLKPTVRLLAALSQGENEQLSQKEQLERLQTIRAFTNVRKELVNKRFK